MDVLKVDNTNLYYIYAAVTTVVATVLFVMVSPGFVYRANKTKYASRSMTLVHALAFMLLFGGTAILLALAYKRMHQTADDNERSAKVAALVSQGQLSAGAAAALTVGGGYAAGRTSNFVPGRVYAFDRSCATVPFGYGAGNGNMNGYGAFTGLAEP